MAVNSHQHRVFTYGTLKQGQPNHQTMTNPEKGSATYQGDAHTVKTYPLVVATEFNVPFVLDAEGQGMEVQGEVYEVDDKMLASLDELEKHPDIYTRLETEVVLCMDRNGHKLESPQTFFCWLYFLKNFKKDFLQLQFLPTYKDGSEECGSYVRKEQRTGVARTGTIRNFVKEDP